MKHLALVLLNSFLATAAASSPPSSNNELDLVKQSEQVCTTPGECTGTTSSVYVIGDLHGDAMCAVSWVNRTGLVGNLFHPELIANQSLPLHLRLNPSSKWSWSNDQSSLVFMGDYVDKGPTSKQTVQFVRDLTLQFPDRVTALLGNHELELLRDRDSRISPESRYGSYSYASIHPGEYHNYFEGSGGGDGDKTDKKSRSLDQKDEVVLNLLLEASMEVYSFGAHNAVRFVPSAPASSNGQRAMYAITDIIPPEHRLLAKERLEEYQDAYYASYRSGTPLGSWLESRPVSRLCPNRRFFMQTKTLISTF